MRKQIIVYLKGEKMGKLITIRIKESEEHDIVLRYAVEADRPISFLEKQQMESMTRQELEIYTKKNNFELYKK